MRSRWKRIAAAFVVLFVLIAGLVIGFSRTIPNAKHPPQDNASKSGEKRSTKTASRVTRTRRHSADSGVSTNPCVPVPVARPGQSTYPEAIFEIENRQNRFSEAGSLESLQPVTSAVRITVSVITSERKLDPGYHFFRDRPETGSQYWNPGLKRLRRFRPSVE